MFPLVFYALTAGLATFVGAAAVLIRREMARHTLTRLMGFGSGVLISAAFLHLIPESLERSAAAGAWGMLLSMLLFIAIEQFVHARTCQHHGECTVEVVGVMAFTALFVHSLVDGLAIAAGLRASPELGLTMTIAVIAHEVPEGTTSVSLFRAAGYSRGRTFLLASLVAFATPFGAFAAWFWTAGIGEAALGALLGFAAGSFIYVATADILPRLHEEQDIPAFVYILVGAVIPMLLLFLD